MGLRVQLLTISSVSAIKQLSSRESLVFQGWALLRLRRASGSQTIPLWQWFFHTKRNVVPSVNYPRINRALNIRTRSTVHYVGSRQKIHPLGRRCRMALLFALKTNASGHFPSETSCGLIAGDEENSFGGGENSGTGLNPIDFTEHMIGGV